MLSRLIDDIDDCKNQLSLCGFSIFTFLKLKKCKKKDKNGNGNGSSVLTTGPVIRSAGVGNLYVKILNNTNINEEVRITVFDIDECPKEPAAVETVTVEPKCAVLETFDIGPAGLDLEEFEVQIEFLSGATEGIYAFIAGAQGNSFNLEPGNVFRHEELVPQIDP